MNVTLALASITWALRFGVRIGRRLHGRAAALRHRHRRHVLQSDGRQLQPVRWSHQHQPTDSGAYQGISFWQPRGDPMEIHLSGSANVSMTGTLYNVGDSYTRRERQFFRQENLTSTRRPALPSISGITSVTRRNGSRLIGSTGGTIQMNPGTAARDAASHAGRVRKGRRWRRPGCEDPIVDGRRDDGIFCDLAVASLRGPRCVARHRRRDRLLVGSPSFLG